MFHKSLWCQIVCNFFVFIVSQTKLCHIVGLYKGWLMCEKKIPKFQKCPVGGLFWPLRASHGPCVHMRYFIMSLSCSHKSSDHLLKKDDVNICLTSRDIQQKPSVGMVKNRHLANYTTCNCFSHCAGRSYCSTYPATLSNEAWFVSPGSRLGWVFIRCKQHVKYN